MTSRADQNDKWAEYAGPGGWNGKLNPLVIFLVLMLFSVCSLVIHSYTTISIGVLIINPFI